MKDGFWFQTGRDDTIGKESGVCFPLRSTSHKTHRGSALFFVGCWTRNLRVNFSLSKKEDRQQLSNNKTGMARGEDKQLSYIIITSSKRYYGRVEVLEERKFQ
jgi:hypothetical protein